LLADEDKKKGDAALIPLAAKVNDAKTGTTALDTAAKAEEKAKQKTFDDAKGLWEKSGVKAKASESAAKPLIAEIDKLRGESDAAEKSLAAAIVIMNGKKVEQTKAQATVDAATKKHAGLVVTCKAAAYDTYKKNLADAEKKQNEKIAAIEKLIAAKKKPAAGEVGARCEKAPTLGDFKARGPNPCKDMVANCCGAAKGEVAGAWMTVETCQARTTKEFDYIAPRAPLAITWPAAKKWKFACISGAKQLAGAAVSLAASAYMMA